MAYTAVDAVFQTFRRRLTAEQGLEFASILPSVPRAIFVAGWAPQNPPAPWADRVDLIAEAQRVRKDHNLTPETCIEDTSWALQRAIRPSDWARAMARLPEEARAFWHIEVENPAELQGQIR